MTVQININISAENAAQIREELQTLAAAFYGLPQVLVNVDTTDKQANSGVSSARATPLPPTSRPRGRPRNRPPGSVTPAAGPDEEIKQLDLEDIATETPADTPEDAPAEATETEKIRDMVDR